MKKITRLKAIIKGQSFAGALFGNLKEKKIRRALEAASDNAEKQKEEASIAYESLFSSMAEESADCERIIRSMLEYQQTIISADNTIKAIAKIKADLDTEIEVED